MAADPADLREEYLRIRQEGGAIPSRSPLTFRGLATADPESRKPVTGDSREPGPKPIAVDRTADDGTQFDQVARGLAELLPGWRYQHRPEDRGRAADLVRTDGSGARFYLRRHDGRIEVGGDWPRARLDGTRFFACDAKHQPHEYRSVTVSLARSVESIAADLARRFVPGYLAHYAERCQARDEHDADVACQSRAIRRLATIDGGEPRNSYADAKPGGPADSLYTDSGVTVKATTYRARERVRVRLEFETDEDSAAAVLALCRQAVPDAAD